MRMQGKIHGLVSGVDVRLFPSDAGSFTDKHIVGSVSSGLDDTDKVAIER